MRSTSAYLSNVLYGIRVEVEVLDRAQLVPTCPMYCTGFVLRWKYWIALN